MKSVYEEIGGSEAVDAAVDIFYRKVLKDERISFFFEDTDMDEQIQKQKGFLTYAFGGPHLYTGKNMKEAHAPLLKKGLNDQHVDVVIELLSETLRDLKVSNANIEKVTHIAESVRGQVLGRE